MSMMFSHFTIGDIEYQVTNASNCALVNWPRLVDKVQREVMRKHHKAAELVPRVQASVKLAVDFGNQERTVILTIHPEGIAHAFSRVKTNGRQS